MCTSGTTLELNYWVGYNEVRQCFATLKGPNFVNNTNLGYTLQHQQAETHQNSSAGFWGHRLVELWLLQHDSCFTKPVKDLPDVSVRSPWKTCFVLTYCKLLLGSKDLIILHFVLHLFDCKKGNMKSKSEKWEALERSSNNSPTFKKSL